MSKLRGSGRRGGVDANAGGNSGTTGGTNTGLNAGASNGTNDGIIGGFDKEVLKSRDKVLTKMTRDGVVEQNMATKEETRISKRDVGFNLRKNQSEVNTDDSANTDNANGYGAIGDNSYNPNANETSVKPGNQVANVSNESSSQVGIKLNRHDAENANAPTNKEKAARIRRKQELSKGNNSGNETVQTPSAQTPGSSDNVIPSQPNKPLPVGSRAAVYDFSDIADDDSNADDVGDSTITDSTNINHETTRQSKLKPALDDSSRPKDRITHKSKTPTALNEHRLSNIRNTSNTGKFTFVPPADDNGCNSSISDPAKPKHSKRRKHYKTDNSKIVDEAENKSKLNFADDETDAVAGGSDADSGLDATGDSLNPTDQDLSSQDNISPHQPRSPTDSNGSTATSSTSSRNKQVRHKRQNADKSTDPSDSGDMGKLDTSTSDTPLSEKPTPPRSAQSQKGQGKKSDSPNGASTDKGSPKPSSKLSKLEHDVNKTSNKLDRAKNKLPTKHKIRVEKSFNEDSGKVSTRLRFDKEVKSQAEHLKGPLPLRPLKFGANAAIAKAHMKIYQVEHENVGVKAAHKVELAGEAVVRSALRHRKLAPYKKVAKLERSLSKRSAKLAYRRAVESNPRLKKNPLASLWQKHRIKRKHAKALRQSQKVAGKAKKAGSLMARATRALTMLVKKNPKVIIAVILIFVLINIFSSLIGLLSSLGGAGANAVFATTYLSEEIEIENVSLAYNRWEMDLFLAIQNAEQSHPSFDEYRFNTGEISHNPLELIAYLTATRLIFTLDDIEAELRSLFDEQYQLSFAPSVEVRYIDSGELDAEDNPIYAPTDWHVMTVTLTAQNFTSLIHSRMTPDERIHFDMLMQTRGHRQIVGNPFAFGWQPFITSEYGYRIHPITGELDLHRGIDIGLPTGTEILAGFDGVVTFAGVSGGYGNVVFIEGDNGIEARYAHMDTIGVTVGQSVNIGDVIGTVGSTGVSTGPHLHMEVLRNGQFLNPIFFVDMGVMDFTNPEMPPTNNNAPLPPMGDGSFEALLELGNALLGRPYVWGASGPNSFDCSGLVYFLLNHSGAANVGRTTAQGYYNMSSIVPANQAQPGDLIFFHSTFSSPRFITHVGIYLGNSTMLHTGSNPNGVEIVSINTLFWQNHFHAFGRVN